MQRIPKFLSFIKPYYLRFKKSEILLRSAGLAFLTLLAIVPVLGLAFLYLRRIGMTEHWLRLTKDFVLSQLNVSSSELFMEKFNQLTAAAQGTSRGLAGFLILIYTVWSLIQSFGDSLEKVLITAADFPEVHRTPLTVILRRAVVMIGLPIALTVSIVISQWIRKDSWFHLVIKLKWVGPVIALPAAWAVDIVVFFLVYYLIPRNSVRWREALKVALFVGPLSEILRFAFGVYSHHAIHSDQIYGVLILIPVFFFWMQLQWILILAGGLWLRVTHPHRGH